ALDPDMASQGGTGLAPALRQGGELLQASPELADRVLVVFTDGEAHDSLPPIVTQAQRLKADGTHLILVAEGGRSPTRIPMRDDHGGLLGYQKDEDGRVIETVRRDDMLGGAADAAQGTLVAADLPDQAGAVRDLVASYRRARASETRTEQSRPRAWLPLLLAVGLLVAQAASRRTAALVRLAIACLVALPARNVAQQPPLPRSPQQRWGSGRPEPGSGRAAPALDRPRGVEDAPRSDRPDAAPGRAGREGLVTPALWLLVAMQSAPPDVTARVDRARLPAGDELTLTIRARSRSAEPVALVLPGLTGFTIVGSREVTEV